MHRQSKNFSMMSEIFMSAILGVIEDSALYFDWISVILFEVHLYVFFISFSTPENIASHRWRFSWDFIHRRTMCCPFGWMWNHLYCFVFVSLGEANMICRPDFLAHCFSIYFARKILQFSIWCQYLSLCILVKIIAEKHLCLLFFSSRSSMSLSQLYFFLL